MARFSPTDEIELSSGVAAQAVHAPVSDNVVVPEDDTRPESKRSLTTRASVQFASLCLTMLLAGWNDASTGPLLPRIQAVYHVGFAIVSLVFVLSSVGFVVGSISNVVFNDKLGFGKTMVLGSASCVAGYAIQISAPPFPVFTIGYFLNGFGLALLNAPSNGYVASLRDPTRMGILHATYECLAQIGLVNEEEGSIDGNKFYQIFRLKALHVLASFILVYVGTELTIGGWIVTYISQVRGGGASSGYISSGFFGGIVVGRTLLLWVNKRVGERIVIFIYVALAIGLELIIWFVPSFIGGAVSIALVGVFMGPIYPIVMNESRRVLPRWLLTACIGWIAGFGQTGSAILPFMTGAIASKAGIKSLQPLSKANFPLATTANLRAVCRSIDILLAVVTIMPETAHNETVTSALSAPHNLDPNSSRLYNHASASKISLHKMDNEDGIELAKLPQAETLSSKDPGPNVEVEAASESGHASVAPEKGAHRLLANIQFFSLCYTLFLAGWNDGTTGPLLPRIQSVYNVGWLHNCLARLHLELRWSVSNIWLTDKLGFGKAIVLGSASQAVAYCLQAPGPPFPLFVIAYCINGFGMAIQDAQANGYVASYKDNAAAKMGILHATYGAGALAAPLVATQFAQLHHWSFHYLASLGVALSNALILAAVFRFKRQDECLAQIGQSAGEQGTSEDSKYRQIFRLKELHLLAFFIFVYVGVEVTLGGWIVTYVRQVRGGGASSGYISAGFFGGLMVGRVALLWVNKAIGERLVIFFYVLLAIGLELVIWLVPSLIGGAVAVSIVGVLLGPVYPIVMNESSRILPRWLLTGCIGWIAGFGQTGSAILPFMTGAIASKAGIKSLQPVLVSMMGLLVVLWALVPRGHSRAD
ncbi:hypothetical protein EVG20_g9203 [Dentipellis fragilis]|uniref:Major facilitator superfamily (MFS) profile domain-containing protein n=1 Tax=Dentipellis fragilis TaxID=205917 RepID=A0A4Y9Y084_9AGAM|nr:hypothetical protein EVG20_g9203 [Dentipellis fragilis]